MSDLSPETDKLLELARGAGALGEARRAQIKASLLSQIAAGGALSAAASHATWGKAAWLSSPLAKGISVLALLSAVGVGVGVYAAVRASNQALSTAPGNLPSSPAAARAPGPAATDRASEARPMPGPNDTPSSLEPNARVTDDTVPSRAPPAPDALVVTPPSPAAVSASGSKTSVGVAHAVPASEPIGAAAGTAADTLAEETGLLRDADQALRAGNAQRALALLDEHAARYPHGVLEPERSAERMIARCKLGQVDEKTARAYLATHASSPFTARLKDACSRVNR